MKKKIEIDLTRLDWGKLEKKCTFLMLSPDQLVTQLVNDFLHPKIDENESKKETTFDAQ